MLGASDGVYKPRTGTVRVKEQFWAGVTLPMQSLLQLGQEFKREPMHTGEEARPILRASEQRRPLSFSSCFSLRARIILVSWGRGWIHAMCLFSA